MNLNSLAPEIKTGVRGQKEEGEKDGDNGKGREKIMKQTAFFFFFNLKDENQRKEKNRPIEGRDKIWRDRQMKGERERERET